MADGTQLNSGANGDIILTDDVTQKLGTPMKVEVVKPAFGPDGDFTLVDNKPGAKFPVEESYVESLLQQILVQMKTMNLILAQGLNVNVDSTMLENDSSNTLN